MFTSLLKKKNNVIFGWDISPTAIKKAQVAYPDITFVVTDISNSDFISYCDLIVIREVLSYIKNWKEVIKRVSKSTKYVFVSLDLPDEPVGFVKSFYDLEHELDKYFDMLVYVKIQTKGNQILFLGKVKNE